MDPRVHQNLRSLGVDLDRSREIPEELADWIAKLTPEDLERIREDVKELARIGLLSPEPRGESE